MNNDELNKLIQNLERTLQLHEIKLESLNHPDPEPVVNKCIRNSDKKYLCECGSQILFRNKKRHETSGKHIRGVVQITE